MSNGDSRAPDAPPASPREQSASRASGDGVEGVTAGVIKWRCGGDVGLREGVTASVHDHTSPARHPSAATPASPTPSPPAALRKHPPLPWLPPPRRAPDEISDGRASKRLHVLGGRWLLVPPSKSLRLFLEELVRLFDNTLMQSASVICPCVVSPFKREIPVILD